MSASCSLQHRFSLRCCSRGVARRALSRVHLSRGVARGAFCKGITRAELRGAPFSGALLARADSMLRRADSALRRAVSCRWRGLDAPSRRLDAPSRTLDAPSRRLGAPSRGLGAPSRGLEPFRSLDILYLVQ